jgi:hypothetical protein
MGIILQILQYFKKCGPLMPPPPRGVAFEPPSNAVVMGVPGTSHHTSGTGAPCRVARFCWTNHRRTRRVPPRDGTRRVRPKGLQPEAECRLSCSEAQPVFLDGDVLAIREGEVQRQAKMPFVGIADTTTPGRPAQHQAAAWLDAGSVRRWRKVLCPRRSVGLDSIS